MARKEEELNTTVQMMRTEMPAMEASIITGCSLW